MGEPVSLRLDPSIPNSRLGRRASPLAQGWDEMEITVGIDVSKDRLDVFVHPAGERLAVTNDAAGIDELVERLRVVAADGIGLEGTGGLERLAVAGLAAAGLPVLVLNPAQIRHYARALGQRAKTDRIDAAVIARFLAATGPRIRPLADPDTLLLGELMARRRQLVGMLVAEKNRHARAPGRLKASIARIIKVLADELAALDDELDTMIRNSPAWRHKENLLASVPGIGRIIARTLMAELPELGRLDRRAIAALCGLAPFTRQSRRWRGRSMIGGGRPEPRAALFIGALVASRHNPVLKAFCQRLIDAGKPRRIAIIACARKLITILNAIIREQIPWQQT